MASRLNLSEIPPPDVVQDLNYTANLARITEKLKAALPGWRGSLADPIQKAAEVFAYEQTLLQAQINESARQTMIAFAKGTNLDNLGALFGLKRAETTLSGEVVAETDEAFRNIIISGPDGYSTAGSESSYEHHIRRLSSANDTKKDSTKINLWDVNAYSPEGDGPRTGKVSIVLLFSDYALAPTTETIDARKLRLHDLMKAEGIIPIKDVLSFEVAELKTLNLSAVLSIPKGPDPSAVKKDAETRVKDLLERNFKIGREIGLSSILSSLHVEGVTTKVNLFEVQAAVEGVVPPPKPFVSDITPAPNEVALIKISITVNDEAGK